MRLSTGCVLALAMLLLPSTATNAADSPKVKSLEARLKALREMVKKAEGELEKAKNSEKESARKWPGRGPRRHGFAMHRRHGRFGRHSMLSYRPWGFHRSPFLMAARPRMKMPHKKPIPKKIESKKPTRPKFPRFGFRRPTPKKKSDSKSSVEERLEKIARELESIRRELKK